MAATPRWLAHTTIARPRSTRAAGQPAKRKARKSTVMRGGARRGRLSQGAPDHPSGALTSPAGPACPPSWRGYRAEGSKNQKGPTRSTRAGPVRSTRRGRARPSDTVPGGSAAGSRPSPTYFRGLAIARRVPTATCWAKPRPYCRQSNRRASSIRSGCRHWSTCGYWRIGPVVSYRATGLSASPRALGRPVGNECMGCAQPVDGAGDGRVLPRGGIQRTAASRIGPSALRRTGAPCARGWLPSRDSNADLSVS
jgi:hypothetical protein